MKLIAQINMFKEYIMIFMYKIRNVRENCVQNNSLSAVNMAASRKCEELTRLLACTLMGNE